MGSFEGLLLAGHRPSDPKGQALGSRIDGVRPNADVLCRTKAQFGAASHVGLAHGRKVARSGRPPDQSFMQASAVSCHTPARPPP